MERFECIAISRPLSFQWALKTLITELRESCHAVDWQVCWRSKGGWTFLMNDANGKTCNEVDTVKGLALLDGSHSYVKLLDGGGSQIALTKELTPLPHESYTSILQFLLIDLNGRIFGSVVGRAFGENDVFEQPVLSKISLRMELINSLVNIECEKLRAEEVAQKEKIFASHDVLTSVLNRRGWQEVTYRYELCQVNSAVVVISIDLDGLKNINDSVGHAVGDELIKRAAEVIKNNVGCNGIVARLGGDEFAAIVPAASYEIGSKIIHKLENELQIFGIAASIGYVWTKQCKPISSYLKYADEKMYVQKKEKKLAMSSP